MDVEITETNQQIKVPKMIPYSGNAQGAIKE